MHLHVAACCSGISKFDMGVTLRARMAEAIGVHPMRLEGLSPHMPRDEQIIAEYSTPGLKKCELTRQAKKLQLQESYKADSYEEREALLDRLYPPE
jgi:hypothetical protein